MGSQMMQQPIPSPQQQGGGPPPPHQQQGPHPPPPHPISQSPMSHNSPMGAGGGGPATPNNHPSPMHPGAGQQANGAPMRSPMHRSATPVSSHGGHTPSHAPKTADDFNLDFLDGIPEKGGDSRSQHNATPSQRSSGNHTPGPPVPPGASPAHSAAAAAGGPPPGGPGHHGQQDEFSQLFN